jgi:Na+-driven multidrug efflux pump
VDSLAWDATKYAWILATCIPVRVVFIQLEQYFQAQAILSPGVIVSTTVMVCNLLLGLVLVLGVGVPGWAGFGFLACPTVTAMMEFLQLGLFLGVFCYVQQLHKPCWPGFSFAFITSDRVWTYTRLLFPALLSNASDFWRWATVGAFAAHLGEVEVGVFNASYRILWICYAFTGALASAVGIRLGIALGAGDPRQAKFTSLVGCGLALVLLSGLGLLVYRFPRFFANIFSSDPHVHEMFESIRVPLALVMVFQNLSILLEQIPVTMGRTSAVFFIGFVGSWLGQVPGVVLCFWLWREDLVGLYTGVTAGYFATALLLGVLVLTSDWARYSQEAQQRAEIRPSKSLEAPDVPIALAG